MPEPPQWPRRNPPAFLPWLPPGLLSGAAGSCRLPAQGGAGYAVHDFGPGPGRRPQPRFSAARRGRCRALAGVHRDAVSSGLRPGDPPSEVFVEPLGRPARPAGPSLRSSGRSAPAARPALAAAGCGSNWTSSPRFSAAASRGVSRPAPCCWRPHRSARRQPQVSLAALAPSADALGGVLARCGRCRISAASCFGWPRRLDRKAHRAAAACAADGPDPNDSNKEATDERRPDSNTEPNPTAAPTLTPTCRHPHPQPPGQFNALSQAMLEALLAELQAIAADKSVRGGAGRRRQGLLCRA